MKYRLLTIPLLLIAFSSLFSCVNNSEEDLYGLECDTLNMTYSKVKYIFEYNCFVCHKDPQGPNMIKFNSYSEVKEIVNTNKLLRAIKQTGVIKMPYGQPKLDSCLIAKIGAWIHTGMPE